MTRENQRVRQCAAPISLLSSSPPQLPLPSYHDAHEFHELAVPSAQPLRSIDEIPSAQRNATAPRSRQPDPETHTPLLPNEPVPNITVPAPSRSSSSSSSSSSPGSKSLLSPSAFLRLPSSAITAPQLGKGLKSGSRAQPAPQGASVEFVPVGGLWKSRFFTVEGDGERVEGGDGSKDVGIREGVEVGGIQIEVRNDGRHGQEMTRRPSGAKKRKSTGKLVRPAKRGRKGVEREVAEVVAAAGGLGAGAVTDSPKQPDEEVINARHSKAQEVPVDLSQVFANDTAGIPREPPLPGRSQNEPSIKAHESPGIPLPDITDGLLGNAAEQHHPILQQAPAPAKITKKGKRKAAAATATAKGTVAKASIPKAKRRKKKSESIILNSDDVGDGHLDVLQHHNSDIDQPKRTAEHSPTTLCAPTAEDQLVSGSFRVVDAERLHEGWSRGDYHVGRQDDSPEKSVLFLGISAGAKENHVLVTSCENRDAYPGAAQLSGASQAIEVAPRRRKSWTPVKDTVAPREIPGTNDQSTAPDNEGASLPPLAEVLGRYAFQQPHDEREPSNTTETSKTRTSTTETSIQTLPQSESTKRKKKPPKNAPKRAKAPPKKPQTITALATAAYQKAVEPAQPVVEKTITLESHHLVEPPKVEPPETKSEKTTASKPRKPKAKADGATLKPKPTRPSKSTKKSQPSRVKVPEIDDKRTLYSPSRAFTEMHRQDFLFGTSSQLAIDETPSFIRDMQTALYESELEACCLETHSSQQRDLQVAGAGPQRGKSCMRVPTAPHRTSLSVEQTGRELWCVAARGRDGGLFRHKRLLGASTHLAEGTNTADAESCPPKPNTELAVAGDREVSVAPSDPNGTKAMCGPHVPETIVDITCSSPPVMLVSNNDDQSMDVINPAVQLDQCDDGVPVAVVAGDDSWLLLRSDSPVPQKPASPSHCLPTTVVLPAAPQDESVLPRIHSAISPVRSPLRSLDTNTNLAHLHSPHKPCGLKQARALSTRTPLQGPSKEPAKRPRGRPRKDSIAVDTEAAKEPARRGRSPKTTTATTRSSATPRKAKKIAKSRHSPPSASASKWMTLDEISDSDSPTTPSPPRRHASSPPAVQPLELQPLDPPGNPVAPISKSGLKPDNQGWASIAPHLFPRITAIVKADHGPSLNATRLPWWDKILMYDPIEIEELASWLTAQGVTYTAYRARTKAKKRGRKKKGVTLEVKDVGNAGNEEQEWEAFEEQVKPWMVQKWCEEHSICCLWKESGHRAIVRGRY